MIWNVHTVSSSCTGQLESVHSLYTKYATKRKRFLRKCFEARLKTAALDHNLWRATAKNRPGAIQTAVFQRCRRVHGGSKEAQVRLHLQEGHCVRCVAQGRGCIYPCSTETTHTLAWHKGVGKTEYVARKFSRFELLLPHEAPWKPQDNPISQFILIIKTNVIPDFSLDYNILFVWCNKTKQ